MIATIGLAKGIIDDTCLVLFSSYEKCPSTGRVKKEISSTNKPCVFDHNSIDEFLLWDFKNILIRFIIKLKIFLKNNFLPLNL